MLPESVFQKISYLLILPRIKKSNKSVNPEKTLTAFASTGANDNIYYVFCFTFIDFKVGCGGEGIKMTLCNSFQVSRSGN